MAEFIRLAFTAALLAASSARAEVPPDGGLIEVTLKESAVVSADLIELRDVALLAEGAPAEVGRLRLGNSPWPGQVRRISRVLLKVRLVSAGFDLSRLEFKGSDACLVELESLRTEGDEIVAAARRHLEAQFPADGPEVQIELLQQVRPVLVPAAGGPVELSPSFYGVGPPLGSVRVDVDVVRDGKCLKKVPVSFSVKVYEQVAVAMRRIGAGEALTGANVSFVRRNTAHAAGVCLRAREELSGKVAARSIRAGQTITRRAVTEAEKPLVIDLNQRVFLVVETRTLRAVTVGKSLGRAREGEVARAKNLRTGREVVGLAMGDSTIRVFLEGQ